MNTILLILCNALSCFIISNILFQFMNGKYKRSSQNRYAYIVIEAVTVIFTTCINMLNHFHIKFGGLGRVDGDNSICSCIMRIWINR